MTPDQASTLFGFCTAYAQAIQAHRSTPYLSALMVQATARLVAHGVPRDQAILDIDQTVIAIMDDVESYAL